MNRRDFLQAGILGSLSSFLPARAKAKVLTNRFEPVSSKKFPEKIASMTPKELWDDYHNRLFNKFLPFWDKGGYDSKYGGFMCELYDNGSVQSDEKYIWYQGRAIWVYSYLCNNFGQNPKYLEIAQKTRDFMVKFMYKGNGRWHKSVNRIGNPVKSTGQQEDSPQSIYGALFAAAGLIQLCKATKNEEDLEIAKTSILEAVKRYDSCEYAGIKLGGKIVKGLRAQGHSFMIVWPLTQLLEFHQKPALERLQSEHVDIIMSRFWNPDYGIVNEKLNHDYSRIKGYEDHMFASHSLETQWMIMLEAVRIKDTALFNEAKERSRRIIEMCWDYVHGGWAGEDFYVFSTDKHCRGPKFEVKTMWAHTEVMLACMIVLQYTAEAWAKQWYERARMYVLRTMANTGNGVWRQAVDRFGNNVKRNGISAYRKGNYHQPRYMMMTMKILERMI